MAFTTNTYECTECGYRWHNPLSKMPESCPRCKLIKEILFKAEKAQVPFSGHRRLRYGLGVELNTPNGWIEILIRENERIFVKNEYSSLIRPISILDLETELWTELKKIQKHVSEEARRQGKPTIQLAIMPEGTNPDDLTFVNDQNPEGSSQIVRDGTKTNRAERRRRQRR